MRPADLVAIAAAAALSAAACALALAYAKRRGLIDLPGRRRSHALPTPRGGGIGIAVAVLALALAPGALAGDPAASLLAGALAAVAAVGWWDDHRPLSARLRLGVHGLASLAVAIAAFGPPADATGAALLALVVLALTWSINLHNFIDGIDGLLGLQALAVAAILGGLAARAGQGDLALWCAIVAAACAGFLPFNLPRARIFLGDAGSGALGLLLGTMALLAWRRGVLDVGALLLLLSACGVDATATLLSRMARGRRWWRPHREHLYQWLVRCGASHLRVAFLYLAWTVCGVPLVLVLREVVASSAWAVAHPAAAESLYFAGWPSATLACALGLWWAGKRACLRRARSRIP